MEKKKREREILAEIKGLRSKVNQSKKLRIASDKQTKNAKLYSRAWRDTWTSAFFLISYFFAGGKCLIHF